MGISRKTVKKYIQAYLHKDLPAAIIHPPAYQLANRSKRKLIEEVRQAIDQYLKENEEKRRTGRGKQCMAATDIFQQLLALGHKIGYTTVCNYIRATTHPCKEIFIKQRYEPGHTVEFDWGEARLTICGEDKRIMLAVFTAAYSNYRYARLFYRQDMASFLQSHVLFLEHTGRVPKEIVYDNMRVAVGRYAYRQQEKAATEDLLKLSAYYGFHYRFCNARKGNEKGHVERSVEYIRRKAFCQKDDFESLLQANEHLQERCGQLNLATVRGHTKSISSCFADETAHMHPFPGSYDIGEYQSLRLDKYHCISIDTNCYSVPETLKGALISVRLYPDAIYLYEGSQRGSLS